MPLKCPLLPTACAKRSVHASHSGACSGSNKPARQVQCTRMADAAPARPPAPRGSKMVETFEWTAQFRRVPPRIGDDFQVTEFPDAAGGFDAVVQANKAAHDGAAVPSHISASVGHGCVPIWSPVGPHDDEYNEFLSLVRACPLARMLWQGDGVEATPSPPMPLQGQPWRVTEKGGGAKHACASSCICYPPLPLPFPPHTPPCHSSRAGKPGAANRAPLMSCCWQCTVEWIAIVSWPSGVPSPFWKPLW